MRFKVHCLIFLFILSSEKFGEIFGIDHPLIHYGDETGSACEY